MLEFFYCHTETYHNGVLVGTSACEIGLAESDTIIPEKVIHLTWDNLEKEMEKNEVNFSVWNFPKGRRVSFFDGTLFFNKNKKDVKEWKSPLNVDVHVYNRIFKPSLNEILNWDDAEMATRYLQQHNLKIRA